MYVLWMKLIYILLKHSLEEIFFLKQVTAWI